MESPDYPSRQSASYERKRASRACQVCRTRKTKCDNKRPTCGFCQASGGECRYPDDSDSEYSKLDRGTLAILQRLGKMEKGLGDLVRETGLSSRRLVKSPVGSSSTMRDPERIDELRASPSHPPDAQIITEGAEMTVDNILKWPVLELDPASIFPAVKIMGQQEALRPASGGSIFDLDPETVHYLVGNFLANNHIKNPILDVNLLQEQVQSFVQKGVAWDDTSCLILLICAISVISPGIDAEAQPGYSRNAERLARAEMFFQAAQRRIAIVYHGTSLLAIQCGFLTAVYLMSTFRILAAWKTFSQASTQCVGWFAARREVTNDVQLHVEDSLYWSCFKSELELRAELCLPGSSLNETSYPHVYPSPPGLEGTLSQSGPIFGQLGASSMGSPFSQAGEQLEKGWFFYLAEIALRRIMNDALSARYRKGTWYFTKDWWTEDDSGSYSCHVNEFRQKLEAWYDTLPPPMTFSREPQENLGDPLRGILRSHLVDILDVLYFPAAQAVVCKPSEEISTATLQLAWKGLRNCMDRITLSHEGFWVRHQGTWIMLRTCSRSALQLLAVAKITRLSWVSGETRESAAGLLPSNWREAVESVIRCIEYWEDESPDLGILLARLKCLNESL